MIREMLEEKQIKENELFVKFKQQFLLSLKDSDLFKSYLEEKANKNDKIIINFATIEVMSSQILGSLIAANNILKAKGGLYLENCSPKVMEIFEITRLKRLFNFV